MGWGQHLSSRNVRELLRGRGRKGELGDGKAESLGIRPTCKPASYMLWERFPVAKLIHQKTISESCFAASHCHSYLPDQCQIASYAPAGCVH